MLYSDHIIGICRNNIIILYCNKNTILYEKYFYLTNIILLFIIINKYQFLSQSLFVIYNKYAKYR